MKNLTEQLKEYEAGLYKDPSFKVQCDAGWYDWFCKDSALVRKTDKLYKMVKRILKADTKKLIDPDTMYVSFKNCCPMEGSLYDVIRFFSITGKRDDCVIITPKSGHTSENKAAELFISGEELQFPTFKDLLNHLKAG